MSLQSECGVQRGHDGRGSKESKEHERRYMGGTEILQPLKHIYSQPCYPDHPRQVTAKHNYRISSLPE